jgi:glutamate racemase
MSVLTKKDQGSSQKAIGVFDSGLGGLTVVKELMRELPYENIIYFGDTARVPYGTKSKEAIVRFSIENTHVLLRHQVKMVVVACNSSTSYALPTLKTTFNLPILGVIYPGARKAVEVTKGQRVGIIATSATINSFEYARTIREINPFIKVFSQACPLFVPLVEEGWLKKSVTLDVAEEYLAPLKKAKVDTLILGCTHYPLLKNIIQQVMGKQVTLIDSAKEVAREVRRMLEETRQQSKTKSQGRRSFMVSDRPQEFQKIAKSFLGFDINVNVERNHV